MPLPDISNGRIPTAPAGHMTCNVTDRTAPNRQINHLVPIPTSGPTVCGLTRFGEDADLPGWSMNGGHFGPNVQQAPCPACWTANDPTRT